jgi:hypothetical protein
MGKLRRALAKLKLRIQTEKVFVVVSIVQFVAGLVLANHFISSAWYLVGALGRSMNARNWIESEDLGDAALVSRYLHSLHWSLSQFAPGYFDSRPSNPFESFFAITVLILGMITLCLFTSSLTTSLLRMSSLKADINKQFWLLRRYFQQNQVQTPLALRILLYLEYANKRRIDFVEEDRIPMLELLDDKLKLELKYDVNFGSLVRHPLLKWAHSVSEDIISSFVDKVIISEWLTKEAVHFRAAETAEHMSVVNRGILLYQREGYDDVRIQADDWTCEQALWTHWACRGKLFARCDCNLLLIAVEQFGETVKANEMLWPVMTCYAEVYVSMLNASNAHSHTDVHHAFSEYDVVEGFIESAQVVLNKHVQKVREQEKIQAAKRAEDSERREIALSGLVFSRQRRVQDEDVFT